MKFKFGVKQIVLAAVAVVLVAILIAGNIILQWQAPLLHGFFGGYAESSNVSNEIKGEATEYADQVVQEVAEDSIVLLKNEDDYLPFAPGTQVNLFGWGATDNGFLLVGAGSGGTNITAEKPHRVTLTEAFKANDFNYNEVLTRAYDGFSAYDADYRDNPIGGSTGANVMDSLKNPPESFYTSELMTQAKNYSTDAIAVLSRWGAENGGNSELKGIGSGNGTFLELTAEETAMFNKLQEYGFNVTVLLNTTNPIELGFLETYDNIKACLYIGIPGQSGAMAIPNILLGSKIVDGAEVEISPSGRLNDTYAYNWQENAPSYNNVGITGNIAYTEGIYVGYKWYETADAEGFFTKDGGYDKVVQFPFGYGRSYTEFTQEIKSFELDGKKVSQSDELAKEGTYTVTVHVKNTGDHAGKEVVQLYYTPQYDNGKIEKASINLLAFGKTKLLAAGEETDVALTFTTYDLASYDCYDMNKNGFSGYEVEKGKYDIKLMQNAHTPYDGQTRSFNVTNDIKFETDPVTGTKVENLFTGDSAYAGVAVDGSNGVSGGVTYLSRADKFANYADATKTATASTGNGSPTAAARSAKDNYVYDGYETDAIKAEVSTYQYGQAPAFVIMAPESGGKATQEQLNGSQKTTLTTQTWLFDLLFQEDEEAAEANWKIFLDQLTQNDIKNLIGMSGFQTVELVSIGKPRNVDKDGPAGFNNNVVDSLTMTSFPVFPAETLSGCSWNTELMYDIGRAQGAVGTAMGVQGWYAPGVNLHRSPYNSRNYEYYSEDGRLSGHMAAATIKGAKEENVYCYLKHFALAESGQNSNEWYEWVTEQALRENYCKPFEIAVKVGGANAMMSAFNCVGAVWAGYNHALLTTMLREEWGFQGSVITDWAQNYMGNYGRAIKAGNNMWLRSANEAASIKFDGAGEEYAARQSARAIIYTYIDTLYTSGQETQTATAAPFSSLFVTLWALIDVVLVLGIAACVLFFFWSPSKKRKAAEGAPSADENGEAPDTAEAMQSADTPPEDPNNESEE